MTQWCPNLLRLDQAHAISRGAGVTVAVLDTGIDFDHPALAGRVLAGYDFLDRDADASEAEAPSSGKAFGHGTHVAGLIALVAPEARILPVRVLDPQGVGNVWRIAEGVVYAQQQGASVINLSLSTP
jgi:thermitase